MSYSNHYSSNRKRSRDYNDDQSVTERDKRTVFVTQISVKLRERDLFDFFDDNVGPVKSVRIVTDRNSRRSKGVGYVEFENAESVNKALLVSGRKLLGIPIQVNLTEAEKNRAAEAQSESGPLSKRPAPFKPTMTDDIEIISRRIFVGGLSSEATDSQVIDLFSPFGLVEGLSLPKDFDGKLNRGYAFLQFSTESAAKRARLEKDSTLFLGKQIKVSAVRRSDGSVPSDSRSASDRARESISDGELEVDSSALPPPPKSSMPNKMDLARQELRKKLEEMRGSLKQPATVYLLFTNMFEKDAEQDPDWVQDIADDVREECRKFGPVDKVVVDDKSSEGCVYVSFHSVASAKAAFSAMSGRWFGKKKISVKYLKAEQFHQPV